MPTGALLFDARTRTNLVHPSIGNLSHDSAPVALFAGTQYVFQYGLELGASSGSPDALSHANGFLSMQIAPIPEPATLAILSVAGPFIVRRRPARSWDKL